jgi:hypothetical protein
VSANSAFLELIQLHERMWGMEQYQGRPSLADLLAVPVVAMWVAASRVPPADPKRKTSNTSQPSERFMLTAHKTFEELDDLATSVLIIGKPSFATNWKLSRLYVKQKPVKVRVQVQVIDQ